MVNWLDETLRRVCSTRVAVFGDFCLDAYWELDASEAEVSVETGLPVRRVRRQRYSPGGAGTVTANLAALGVGVVRVVGLVGADPFGVLMRAMLAELGAEVSGLLTGPADWQTAVYGKPMVGDVEQNRMDFGGFNAISEATMDVLAAALDEAAAASDAVILNQQLLAGVSPPAMIERINRVVERRAGRCVFIADSRHFGELYRGVIVKTNAHEALRRLGRPRALDERIGPREAADAARELHARTGLPVFVTRGEFGLAVADGAIGAGVVVHDVPGIQILERTDPVGAGDTAVSAIAATLASGGDVLTAARLANLAASITVRKLHTTGTASPAELLAAGPEPDYVYLPELSDDDRQARFLGDSEIEIVRERPADAPPLRHAIFDHDGTLSTLRQGWEAIMEPMMVRAILGRQFADAPPSLYHKVVEHVRRFIDRTTGVQTLVQMQGLVELVRQFGCVAPADMLDMHGYKAVYDEALLVMVRGRIEKLRRGELSAEDFVIKNAPQLLRRLSDAGLTLYLVSGTDEFHVRAEAEALGYAGLFTGGIFGAVGDIAVEAKREVLSRLVRESGLGGGALVTFGDGPVEMRETHQRGGYCVGIASDEVRRFGRNLAKRTRLIRSGADLIVPDFSQLNRLLAVLGVG